VFESNDIDDAILVVGQHAIRRGGLVDDVAGGDVDRLFLTRQFSHQRSAEPAPLLVQVPGQQRQNEQIQRVHHHAEPVRAAGEQHQLRQT
jgi:hypothetical protein